MVDIFELINKLAENHVKETLNTEDSQLRYLKYWWCKKYNRPFKDPLLELYTLEELYYEYRIYIEREKIDNPELADSEELAKKEEERLSEAEKWAEEEEQKELEELKNKQTNNNKIEDPSNINQNDVKWMQEQLQKGKNLYGEDYGEDLKFEG